MNEAPLLRAIAGAPEAEPSSLEPKVILDWWEDLIIVTTAVLFMWAGGLALLVLGFFSYRAL